MANTVTVTKILNTTKYDVIKLDVIGDGSGDETSTVVYDYSADSYAADSKSAARIEKMWNIVDGTASIDFLWDGAAQVYAWSAPQYSPGTPIDFSSFGGVSNHATTPTGDLVFNTVNLGSGDHCHSMIVIRKA
jgi:hypothetical protein